MHLHKPFMIAIDGPSASGKGTLARRIARKLSLHHLDTGLLYRAIAKIMLESRLDLKDENAAFATAVNLDLSSLDTMQLRDPGICNCASLVAAHAKVRLALIDVQRSFAARLPGAVLDGRDIGTVILPRANIKFFIKADPRVRAERRTKELLERGQAANFDNIYNDIVVRDKTDSERSTAPLRVAEDAHILDTSNLNADEVFCLALALIKK